MLAVLRVVGRGIAAFERYGYVFVIANLVAVVFSLPLITLPAAFAGLARLGYAAHHGPTAHIDDFFSGFRANLLRGVVVAIANAAVIGILWVNFSTFSAQTGLLFVALRILWIMILFVWIAVQIYLWPLLEEMERPDLRAAFYNAGLMALKNPYFTAGLLVCIVVIAALSLLLVVPVLLITPAMIASIANAAVIDRLAAFRAGKR